MVSKLIINYSNKKECGIGIKNNRSTNSAESRNETTQAQATDNVRTCKGLQQQRKGSSQAVPEHCAKATKPQSPYPASHTKINSKGLIGLNVKLRKDFLDARPKTRSLKKKKKKDKLDFIKTNKFCSSKDTIKRMKIDWEHKCAKHLRPTSRIQRPLKTQ